MHLEILSREDRVSREKGLDMMQQGSPMSWAKFASELDTKQELPCRWCRHPIRFVCISLPLFSMRVHFQVNVLHPCLALLLCSFQFKDIHIQMYTHELSVGK